MPKAEHPLKAILAVRTRGATTRRTVLVWLAIPAHA